MLTEYYLGRIAPHQSVCFLEISTMLKVNCFTFKYNAILPKKSVSEYFLTGKILTLVVDNNELTPYLRLTPTNSYQSNYYALELVDGLIVELFNIISCQIKETDKDIIIDAIFTLEFDLDDDVKFIDNEILYPIESDDIQAEKEYYSYKIDGALTKRRTPSLTRSINLGVDSSINLDVKNSIENMTM